MSLNNTEITVLNMSYIGTNTTSPLTSCTAINLAATVQLALTVSNIYGATNTSAARVRLYTSDDGTTYDSSPYATFDNSFKVSSTERVTVPVCPDPRWMKVSVYNQCGTANISTVKIIAARKFIG